MTHDHTKTPAPQDKAAASQTDEEWADAIAKDMEERYGELVEQAHWVDVGEAGW